MIIERPPAHEGAFVYQHPGQGFAAGSAILVPQGEAAVFTKWGRMLGSLGPGRHALNVEVCPFLETARDPYGAYTADVHLVITRPMRGQRFHGQGSQVTDRTGRSARPRLSGTFTIAAHDPKRVIQQVLTPPNTPEGMLQMCSEVVLTQIGACIASWVQNGYYMVEQLPWAGPHLAQAIPHHATRELNVHGIRVLTLDEVQVVV